MAFLQQVIGRIKEFEINLGKNRTPEAMSSPCMCWNTLRGIPCLWLSLRRQISEKLSPNLGWWEQDTQCPAGNPTWHSALLPLMGCSVQVGQDPDGTFSSVSCGPQNLQQGIMSWSGGVRGHPREAAVTVGCERGWTLGIKEIMGKSSDGFGQHDGPWHTHVWVGVCGCASWWCDKGLELGFCHTKPACSWLIIFAITLPENQRMSDLVLLRNSTCLPLNKGLRASLQLDITKCWFLRCNRENSKLNP